VIPLLATVLTIAALVGAGWSFVLLLLSRPVGKRWLLGALSLVELGLVVQAIAGIAHVIGPHPHISTVTFIGYLIGSPLILPAAGWWALAERSRWGIGVLLIGCLVIPVMIVRMNQIWSGFGA
jgi:hypothetical protein